MKVAIILFGALQGALAGTSAPAQERLTENTLRMGDGPSPPARVEDFRWLAGHWHGAGLGAECEEVWAEPLGGAMMGMFRMVREDEVVFYEILILAPRDDSVSIRLKHFHPDLTGWEERDQVVEFPLVNRGERQAWFNGLTFHRAEEDVLRIYLAMRQSDGSVREMPFQLYRVGSDAHRHWTEGK